MSEEITKECWKKIDIVDGHYEISNYGNLMSYVREQPLLRKLVNVHGYYQVSLGHKKTYYVHKLVYLYFGKHNYKTYEKIPFVTHKNYDTLFNFIGNLKKELVCSKVNTSKLDDETVKEIRRRLASGATLKELAKEYDTSDMAIYRAKHRGTPLKKRPKVLPLLGDKHIGQIFAKLSNGKKQTEIAKKLKVSTGVLCRFIKKHKGHVYVNRTISSKL